MTLKSETVKCDICIIGAGSGGLTLAAGASQMGVEVVLIEADKMGGDCLNTGCVPSKSLLAAAKMADNMKKAPKFGIIPKEVNIDYKAAQAHVQRVIAKIAPHDSVARFTGLGVRVIKAEGSFIDEETLIAGDTTIKAKHFVVATGSRALVPPIKGLDTVPYLTNENIFEQTKIPPELLIIGGGAIGIEMANAHASLGSKVTILEMFTMLPRDDSEAVNVLRENMEQKGITIMEGVKVVQLSKNDNGGVKIGYEIKDGTVKEISGSHVMVAIGRRPNIEKIAADKANITTTRRGIVTDKGLRTSNKRIFAIGDVVEGVPQFTHVAGYHAGLILRRLLFKMFWVKPNYDNLITVIYTSPELAQLGMTEESVRKIGLKYKILRHSFGENDRAVTEDNIDGFVKAIVTPRGKILGCTIIGKGAGEQIQLWALAKSNGLGVKALASLMAPYPSLSEATKQTAGSFFMPKLFSARTKKLVKFLKKFG